MIKNKIVRDFDRTLLSSSYEYFCRNSRQKKISGKSYFSNTRKMGSFLKNRPYTILDIDKNFNKTKFQKTSFGLEDYGS